MRSVVLSVGISLDGYIARSDGSVDFLFMPKDFSMAEFFQSIDTMIVGRITYEHSLKMGGSFGGKMKSYIMSRTLEPGERKGAIFTRQSPAELVAELRRQPGKDIWLMGGGILAREFLKADLVDELHIGLIPTLIGGGLPLFPPGFPDREFELTGNQTCSQSMIALKYKRKRAASKQTTRPKPKRKA